MELSTGGDRCFNVCGIERDDKAFGNLSIVRGIRLVQRTRTLLEANLTANRAAEVCFEQG